MYKVDQKKWEKFSKSEQLRNIAAEMTRATQAALHKKENIDWINGAYERAISMIDSSINDSKWKNKNYLYKMRNAVASLYAGEIGPSLSDFICFQTMKEADAFKFY